MVYVFKLNSQEWFKCNKKYYKETACKVASKQTKSLKNSKILNDFSSQNLMFVSVL